MKKNWQTFLKEAVADPAELLDRLALNPQLLSAAQHASRLFPLRVPSGFIDRMQKGNPADPLLQQVLPIAAEARIQADFSDDPLQENAANPLPGLLHKYYGRILLTMTGACAINCRYCFRRHFPYGKNKVGGKAWHAIVAYIQADTSIREVILSGGDPLLAQDDYLKHRINDLAAIPHVKIVRIHSRLPIVIPERMTTPLLNALTGTRLQPVLVTHCNHANELNDSVQQAIEKCRQRKIHVLNQAVLLKGVNDSVEALVHLSERLFECGILPYYLHRLDKVQGATHFTVNEEKMKPLLKALRERLPGYLVPKCVYEQAGALSKMPFMED
ncbi:EF-P beta-lysylation protein EpmB [Rickettsiella grylli]|uniref:L-lysine 2,3-aminomutase n=1 Tax=Rickettsiella grylli TaxID=59196 RepID=A8PN44_9COXI|nr:EF-P beta-lysylation protein EpmB [Rickettsiella grylli]EDP46410.1 radical SAM domain protein [Rickettsiella grylli]